MNQSPTLFDVLDREGRYRGTAAILGRMARAGRSSCGDQVWAVVMGDLDEESVVHGRLVPVDVPGKLRDGPP
jgi:hypothetical protein